MNRINSFSESAVKIAFVSIIVLAAAFAPITRTFAQDDGSFDTGSGFDGSFDTGAGVSYDGSFDTGAASYDGSFDSGTPSYDGSFDTGASGAAQTYEPTSDPAYSYEPDGSLCYGTCDTAQTYEPSNTASTYEPTSSDNAYTYEPTSSDNAFTYEPANGDTAYTYEPNGVGYTNDTSYSNGNCGCSTGSYSTPTYAVTNPSYSSSAYSTPAVGYASQIYSAPATGFTSTPIFVPAPVTHTAAPAPIVYNTPVQQQQQQQQQAQAQQQPIVINNTNTNTNVNPNTNTVTNTNSAPVTQVVSTPPQQIVDYVYPQSNPIYQPTYQPIPVSCSIYASPNSVAHGQTTNLTWNSSGAATAVLSNGIGSVATNGTLAVYPNGSSNYVLTVYGSQGTIATCNVTVTVANNYPSVSLTQIPYTGFDFGPVGDAIYWAALLAFAVAAAYLLVYYRGGAFALATQFIGGNRSNATRTIRPVKFTEAVEAPAETVEAPIVEVAPVAANTRLASVISPIQNLPVAETRRMTSDAMIINHSKNGEAPRIVITRA